MFRWLRERLIAAAIITIFLSVAYHQLWGRHLYLVTAYCDCPVCINVPAYRDGKFASGKKVYWGAAAADLAVPFGSDIELVPVSPVNVFTVKRILRGRTEFKTEDRGGKIKGRHIDIFIPDFLGGHQTALRWGVRKMRIKLNGEWAE